MLRPIFYGFWGCVVTSGALFFDPWIMSSESTTPKAVHATALSPQFSELQVLVAPVIMDTSVSGFLFSNVTLEMNAKASTDLAIPVDMLLQDSYLALLVGNPEFMFPRVKRFDVLKFKEGLKTVINTRANSTLVRSVYMSGVNFLGTGEARSKQKLRSVWLQERTKITELPKKTKSK